MKVTIALSPESLRAMQRYTGAALIVMNAIRKATDIQHRITIGHIQKARLQADKSSPPVPPDQGILRMITRRLRKSIDFSRAKISGTVVESSIGSNVKYAARHEYGYSESETVAPHTRKRYGKVKFLGAEREVKGKLRRSTITRRVRGADIPVRSFTRQAHTPARAPIRRGIEDCLPLYEQEINKAVIASMQTDTA